MFSITKAVYQKHIKLEIGSAMRFVRLTQLVGPKNVPGYHNTAIKQISTMSYMYFTYISVYSNGRSGTISLIGGEGVYRGLFEKLGVGVSANPGEPPLLT